ncbi:MAG: TlpA family protein disulfide reductase [Thermocrispum sp.]
MRRLLACGLAAVLVAGCASGDDAVVSGTEFTFVAPGGQTRISYPPDERQKLVVTGQDLMNPGEQLSTRDFAGKIVILNVWGQWCPPCRAEAPELQKVHDPDGGVVVLGIDVRDPSRDAPQDFMRDRGLTYPSIYDPSGRTMLQLKGIPRNVVPLTLVLDEQHRVANVFLTDLLASDLRPVLRRLTAE